MSFEWPRWCEGWQQRPVQDMIKDLQLILVPVDGCAAGVTSTRGGPIHKPWTFAVSSEMLAKELRGLKCDKKHRHDPCIGRETAKTAFYPAELCAAIHRGLVRIKATVDGSA